MDEATRLLVLLALGGGAFALAGAGFAWFLDEKRRIKRTLTQALGADPQPMLVVRGRGVGIGFDLPSAQVCVAWDRGGWRLSYRLDELLGLELIVDRRVAARAFRGEARRPLDDLPDPEDRVRLRFLFDDAQHPDFTLDLWRPEDEGLRGRLDPDAALEEASRWLARTEALLRRPTAGGAAAAIGAVATPIAATLRARPAPVPAWEDEADEDHVANDPRRAIH